MAEEKSREGEQISEVGNNGGFLCNPPSRCSPVDIDSSCSTPYASAPSSPSRGGAASGYFHSAPASPTHFVILSSSPRRRAAAAGDSLIGGDGFEFEFSARFSGPGAGNSSLGSMISADELFFNGQIRPMNLSSHLQRPQTLSPLLDLEDEEEEERNAVRGRDMSLRSASMRRRARSMSPLRTQWDDEEEDGVRSRSRRNTEKGQDPDVDANPEASAAAMPASASSSRSSSTSSSRHSKRWVFLKDLLYRSKSEGRGNTKDKFWNAMDKNSALKRFKDSLKPSPSESPKGKHKASSSKKTPPSAVPSKPVNAVGKRRSSSQSAHERHYAANRAQAEEMRKKTFLPYRQGLLGCLWFNSRSYGAMNGFARALNPVQSR